MTTAKVIELVGCSRKSFEDAILNAFADAKKTTRGISGIDVVKFSAKVRDDEIVEFRANVKVSFLVER